MNKKFRIIAAAAVLFALFLTSCGPSPVEMTSFSFTVDQTTVAKLEDAVSSSRAVTGSSAEQITVNAALRTADGKDLVPAIALTKTLSELQGTKLTFSKIPMNSTFTVNVEFLNGETVIYSGESKKITINSANLQKIDLPLYRMISTVYVVNRPQNSYSSDFYSYAYKTMTEAASGTAPVMPFAGTDEYCFDSQGNAWTIRDDDKYFLAKIDTAAYCNDDQGYYTYRIGQEKAGQNDYPFYPEYICYDMQDDNLIIIYWKEEDGGDWEYKIMTLPLATLSGLGSITDAQDITNELIDQLDTSNAALLPDLPRRDDEDCSIVSVCANNGVVYFACQRMKEREQTSWTIAAYTQGASPNQSGSFNRYVDLDVEYIFGKGTKLSDVSINDMLFQEGNLYLLVQNNRILGGALVRLDPEFSSAMDILGFSGTRTAVTTATAKFYKDGYYDIAERSKNPYEGPEYKVFSNISFPYSVPEGTTGLLSGPQAFAAILPKKLVFVDSGYTYSDVNGFKPTDKLVTVDLKSFTVEAETVLSYETSHKYPVSAEGTLPADTYIGVQREGATYKFNYSNIELEEGHPIAFKYYNPEQE